MQPTHSFLLFSGHLRLQANACASGRIYTEPVRPYGGSTYSIAPAPSFPHAEAPVPHQRGAMSAPPPLVGALRPVGSDPMPSVLRVMRIKCVCGASCGRMRLVSHAADEPPPRVQNGAWTRTICCIMANACTCSGPQATAYLLFSTSRRRSSTILRHSCDREANGELSACCRAHCRPCGAAVE